MRKGRYHKVREERKRNSPVISKKREMRKEGNQGGGRGAASVQERPAVIKPIRKNS